MSDTFSVDLADGRVLEALELGDAAGSPLVYHAGSPSAAVDFPLLDRAARGAGVRVITCSRPGYGGSTPRASSADRAGARSAGHCDGAGGPRMVDDVADTVALLDHLAIDEFVTLGWSGGGPRALACATELPGRCRAAATLAGVAPYDGLGLTWSAGMAPENVAEYDAAAQGAEVYGAYLERDFLPVLEANLDELTAAMGGLLSPVDAAALSADDQELGHYLAACLHRAGAQGVVGVRDDGLAAVSAWGVDLGSITVPVAVWQGTEDAMVPFAHGAWLADHVPGARAHLLDGEGHVSLLARLPQVLTELRQLSGI